MARRRGTPRASLPELDPATSAWHAREPQEARQVCERAPQSCSTKGQHAPDVHQGVLADGQARSQRRPHREHRRDVLPPPPGAPDRVGLPRRRISSGAGQHEGGHDIDGRLQHGPWPAGHAGAGRARRQERRRLAGEVLGRSALITSRWRPAGPRRPRSCRSRPLSTTFGTHARRDSRGSSSGTWPASTPARLPWPPRGPLSLTSCSHSSRHEARRTCSPAAWPSFAASRDAFRRRRAPLLAAPAFATWPLKRPRHSIPVTISSPGTSSRSPLQKGHGGGVRRRGRRARAGRAA